MLEKLFELREVLTKSSTIVKTSRSSEWGENWQHHRVDKTAFKTIILQSIHFVDPVTEHNRNSRSSWGPLKFGFCTGVVEKIERYCESDFVA